MRSRCSGRGHHVTAQCGSCLYSQCLVPRSHTPTRQHTHTHCMLCPKFNPYLHSGRTCQGQWPARCRSQPQGTACTRAHSHVRPAPTCVPADLRSSPAARLQAHTARLLWRRCWKRNTPYPAPRSLARSHGRCRGVAAGERTPERLALRGGGHKRCCRDTQIWAAGVLWPR